VEVLHGIELDLPENEFTVFVGPSGCGKSTLLRLIAGLEDVTSGEILFDDQLMNRVQPAKRGIAMVFQSYALYPHMTVYENIAFGIRNSRYSKEEIHRRVLEAAENLKVEQLLDRKPKQLSGGQRQRVAIGRAIVRDPKVFLFDEPLSNLDAELRVEMRIQIARLKTKLNTTMIYVTHDQVEAMTLADRIVVLREGHVEQVGTPLELYNAPCNKFVAGFLGSPKMNFLEAPIASRQDNQLTLALPNDKKLTLTLKEPLPETLDKSICLGLRPEGVVECDEKEAVISGKVRVVEHLGSETYVYLRVAPKISLLVRMRGDHPVKLGDIVHLTLPEQACYLFDPKTELALH